MSDPTSQLSQEVLKPQPTQPSPQCKGISDGDGEQLPPASGKSLGSESPT